MVSRPFSARTSDTVGRGRDDREPGPDLLRRERPRPSGSCPGGSRLNPGPADALSPLSFGSAATGATATAAACTASASTAPSEEADPRMITAHAWRFAPPVVVSVVSLPALRPGDEARPSSIEQVVPRPPREGEKVLTTIVMSSPPYRAARRRNATPRSRATIVHDVHVRVGGLQAENRSAPPPAPPDDKVDPRRRTAADEVGAPSPQASSVPLTTSPTSHFPAVVDEAVRRRLASMSSSGTRESSIPREPRRSGCCRRGARDDPARPVDRLGEGGLEGGDLSSAGPVLVREDVLRDLLDAEVPTTS